MDLARRPWRKSPIEQLSLRVLDVLWGERAQTHAAKVRQHASDAEVVVHVGLGPDRVAHRIGKPALQILADSLVWPNHEMAGVSLALSCGEPLFDHLTGAATEELLASVRHAQIGDPAAIATGV